MPTVESFVHNLDTLRDRAKELIRAAQNRQKFYADKSRKPQTFSVGMDVMLNTKNLKLRTDGVRKLMPKFLGPLKITAMHGPVAARLDFPARLGVHPVFHVSLLHPFTPGGPIKPPPWEHVAPDLHADVELLLRHRERNCGSTRIRQYLVQWAGQSANDAEWVSENRISPTLVERYWTSRAPTSLGSERNTPSTPALRRSTRLLGLDPDGSLPTLPSRAPATPAAEEAASGWGFFALLASLQPDHLHSASALPLHTVAKSFYAAGPSPP